MKNETETKDCLGCRLVSGFGIVGIGFYIYAQSKNRRKVEMNVMKVVSAGAIGLGIARLINMDFLKAPKKETKFKN